MSLLSSNLQAFVAIAKIGTVHGAADKLYITQTAVTQRLKSLERSLNTCLFTRTRKGMILTHEGESLLRYCHAALELEGEALSQIAGAGVETEVELSISSPTSMMRSRVLPACSSIMLEYPNLLVQFHVDDLDHRHHGLRSGTYDLAIVNEDQVSKEMRSKALAPEEYVLVCSSKWKDMSLKEIIKNKRIIDFGEADKVTYDYLRKYDLFDDANHSRYFVNRTSSLVRLVCDGLGYSSLPIEITKKYVERGEMLILNDAKYIELKHVLAWYDRPDPPKYFQAIVDSLK